MFYKSWTQIYYRYSEQTVDAGERAANVVRGEIEADLELVVRVRLLLRRPLPRVLSDPRTRLKLRRLECGGSAAGQKQNEW